jgi:spore maturation protein CgeB
MRVLVIDSYYPGFLAQYYRDHPEIAHDAHAQQHAHLMDQHFSIGDGLAAGFRACGCQAKTVVVNARPLQTSWAREHVPNLDIDGRNWIESIALAQIREYAPDVAYIQELSAIGDDTVRRIRTMVGLVVGQIACPIPTDRTFEHHDMMVSSWPPIVDHFRDVGKRSVYSRLAFDHSVLACLDPPQPRYDVSFVGGLSAFHSERNALLEQICGHIPVDVFGYGAASLTKNSTLKRSFRGEVWGLAAYHVLSNSRITINSHYTIDVPGRRSNAFANNQRLYEATGVGTLLLTDAKTNLAQLFGPDREVATYRSADECIAKIRYYLDHEHERAVVARAGQTRTMTEHTYQNRAAELTNQLADALAERTTNLQ